MNRADCGNGCAAGTSNRIIGYAALVVFFSIFIPTICCDGWAADRLPLKHAGLFSMDCLEDGFRKVTDGAGRSLLLAPRGKPIPSAYRNLPTITIPVNRVALESAVYAALLRPLDVLESIVGVGVRMDICYMDDLKKKIAKGEVIKLGCDGPMDYERLKVLSPDVFFAGNWNKKLIHKLDELNIPVAIIDCFEEAHPLGRLEWIKFVAAFFDREDDAQQVFNRAAKKIAAVSERCAAANSHPRVVAGGVFDGKVHVPSAKSVTANMIAIGGGDYIFKDLDLKGYMGGYGNITLEEFYVRAKHANVYILETSPAYGISSIETLVTRDDMLADIKSVRDGNVWCSMPWYWESIDKTDEIIADLAAIFHPKLFPGHRPRHFFKLPEK